MAKTKTKRRVRKAGETRGRKPGWGEGLTRRVLLLLNEQTYAAVKAAAEASTAKKVNVWVREAVEQRLARDVPAQAAPRRWVDKDE